MKIKKKTAVGLAVCGFLASAGVVWATGGFNWDLYFEASKTYDYKVTYDLSLTGNNGPHTEITVTRGPINVITGNFTLTGRVVVNALNALTVTQLQVANDANHDGQITENEWTSVAPANIQNVGSQTIAQTPTVTVNTANDGWRIWMNRTDIGVTSEMVTDHNLQVQGVDF